MHSTSYVALSTFVLSLTAFADDSLQLREAITPNSRYQVQIRVQLQGALSAPVEKGKPEPKPLPLTGESSIDYDERILSLDRAGKVDRAIRVFRRIDFERKLGDTPQKATLRPSVSRVVQVRMNNTEVPFSPDGPLTWGEIDLLRTDVFTPALVGLLPDKAVNVGERWKASSEAVKELTDFEQIEEGGLECRLERVVTEDRHRLARVSLNGTVRGTNEDGQARQQIEGFFTFDLDDKYLSYLTLNGKHVLLSPEGKEVGKVEGRFVLSRRPTTRGDELSDASLRGLALEPGAENTRLLYENDDLKISFLYPRRWRVSGVQGRQVTLDSADGNGLMLTLDSLQKIPTGKQYLAETREWIEKQRGRILRVTAPQLVQPAPLSLEHFAFEAEVMNQKVLLDYFVAVQFAGGATIAARLLPENQAAVRKEVEVIARSLRLR